MTGQDSRLSLMRHWLAYRERWQDAPKVITPRDDDDVAEWRQLGYQVEGPFVLEAEAGAVAERDALADAGRKVVLAFLAGTLTRHDIEPLVLALPDTGGQ